MLRLEHNAGVQAISIIWTYGRGLACSVQRDQGVGEVKEQAERVVEKVKAQVKRAVQKVKDA